MAVATPPAEATNGELISWAFERLNQRDVSALKEFWNDETIERFPDKTVVGADAIAEYFEETFAALPDFQIETITLTEQGADVFVHWQITGTHLGSFLGVAPTGKPVKVDGIDHFVVRDGTVESNFVVFDRMQFAQQIGMLAQDGTAGDRAVKAAFNARTKLAAKLKR